MIYLNIWLLSGLFSYLYYKYIRKEHEKEWNCPPQYNELVMFVTCIVLGVISIVVLIIEEIKRLLGGDK